MLEIANFKGASANKLAEKIGVGNSYFSQQKKNNGSVGSDIKLHLCRDFPDIDPEWLLTGKGSMLRSTDTPKINNNNNASHNIIAQTVTIADTTNKIHKLEKRVIELEAELRAKNNDIEGLRKMIIEIKK